MIRKYAIIIENQRISKISYFLQTQTKVKNKYCLMGKTRKSYLHLLCLDRWKDVKYLSKLMLGLNQIICLKYFTANQKNLKKK